MLGAEMLEADNQLIVDEYLAGLIEHEHLAKEAKVWDNYDAITVRSLMLPKSADFGSSRPISRGDMPASSPGRE